MIKSSPKQIKDKNGWGVIEILQKLLRPFLKNDFGSNDNSKRDANEEKEQTVSSLETMKKVEMRTDQLNRLIETWGKSWHRWNE